MDDRHSAERSPGVGRGIFGWQIGRADQAARAVGHADLRHPDRSIAPRTS